MEQFTFEDLRQLGVEITLTEPDVSGIRFYIFNKDGAEFRYALIGIEMTPDLEPRLCQMAIDALCLFTTLEEGEPGAQ